ncbi:hypothetical protein OJF2_49440 [Aquisphaera giovannonii]|uniref:RedB protein n=1 Tax=Aquisphaera giovannonii TaxID=406548 RepID=A0A5B9W8N4_9BACT|nr:RedB protein [Aquisphaera giovannonii]QEH36381.1 hypothetical protein OJF2_49440 [Aquisphaera giovannonii]
MTLNPHAVRPGGAGSPPGRWPAGTAIRVDPGRPNVLIFLHPLCPCSRATVDELTGALGRAEGRPAVDFVLVRHPSLLGEAGRGIDPRAAALQGCRIWDDLDGAEARRFGVETSGRVLAYDAQGRLAFSGGVTPSRGHRGGNEGLDSVVAFVSSGRATSPSHAVYGCPLASPSKPSCRAQAAGTGRRD